MIKKIIDRIFRDKEGHIVIWQWPNVPLWTWIIATALGFILKNTPKTIASGIGTVALVIWAALEIGWGKSLFRRLVGGIVLISILVSTGMKLFS